MLNKKTVKNILLEVEAGYYNYERYLNDVITRILDKKDVKYLIVRESENNYLTLYKYSQSDYIEWLYNNYDIDDSLNTFTDDYFMIYEYVKENYIDYYIEENILNFINISKFENMLYSNEKGILTITLNLIAQNIRNYQNNEYLIKEYNLNKKLYKELLNTKRKEVKKK